MVSLSCVNATIIWSEDWTGDEPSYWYYKAGDGVSWGGPWSEDNWFNEPDPAYANRINMINPNSTVTTVSTPESLKYRSYKIITEYHLVAGAYRDITCSHIVPSYFSFAYYHNSSTWANIGAITNYAYLDQSGIGLFTNQSLLYGGLYTGTNPTSKEYLNVTLELNHWYRFYLNISLDGSMWKCYRIAVQNDINGIIPTNVTPLNPLSLGTVEMNLFCAGICMSNWMYGAYTYGFNYTLFIDDIRHENSTGWINGTNWWDEGWSGGGDWFYEMEESGGEEENGYSYGELTDVIWEFLPMLVMLMLMMVLFGAISKKKKKKRKRR